MKLLDLFCGAGGSAVGYSRAGFTEIVGVDYRPQPRYPFTFVQADALEYVKEHGHEFDAIHASPPCQHDSWCTPKTHKGNHEDLIEPTRTELLKLNKPFVIENVGGARRKLQQPVKLCGSMFGLRCRRHRYFEINPRPLVLIQPCNHSVKPLLVTTAGSNSRAIREPGAYKSVKNAPIAYGIEWMIAEELKEAIPPAYTEYIGRQLIQAIQQERMIMTKPYLETNPTDRAAEAKELARLAVPYFRLKRELSRAIPTVLRDHEGREDDTSCQ